MLARFARHQGGNIAMTFAVSAIPVALAAGIAVDFSMASRFQTRLQAAVDAATLAAGVDLPRLTDSEVLAIVDDHLQESLDAGDFGQLAGRPAVLIDRKAMNLTVDVDAKYATAFGKIVGIGEIDYAGTASIQAAWGGIEVALVLDNTGSMASENRMTQLKVAATLFVDDLMTLNKVEKRVRIAIVPFTDHVNVGTGQSGAPWLDETLVGAAQWHGCVGSRDAPLNVSDTGYAQRIPAIPGERCPAPLTPLAADGPFLKARIAAMEPAGMTYIPGGVMWGLRALSSTAPFTEGSTAHVQQRDNITKALVVMTDGENTISKNPSSPFHDAADLEEADDLTLAACDAAKSAGIKVYSVTFGASVPQETKAIVKACASAPENYFDADDGSALRSAFSEVARSLTRLYLTQ